MEKPKENEQIFEKIDLDHHISSDQYIHENDDLNDTRFIWNIFNQKPSRISLYSTLDGPTFWSLLPDSADHDNMTINAEISIDGDRYINTYKYLIRLEESVYLSLYEIREDNGSEEENIHEITSITFYYNGIEKSVDDINVYLELFQEALIAPEDVSKYRYIIYNQGMIETAKLDIPKIIENNKIDFFDLYPIGQRESMRKMVRDIESDENSINCVYGEKGSNKQMFINYIVNKSNKNVILVPYNLAETFLSSIEITEAIKRNPNTLFIINDTDGLFNNELLLSGIFQIVDGIFGTSLDIIFSYSDKKYINNKLLSNSNNIIKFNNLSDKEISRINKYLTDEEKELIEKNIRKKSSSYF